MAVIPQIVTSPGAVPSTGGSGPRVSPQVNIPTPADPSQALGAAAGIEASAYQTTARAGDRLADYGNQFADQYVRAKLNVAAADHQAELSKQLHEAEFEASKIADRQAATADFDARTGKIRDSFAAQDVNPTVRAAVDASLPNQIALRRASTQQAAFGLESKDQVGKLVGNIDQYNRQAVDAQDPRLTEQIIQQANDAIDGRVAGGWLGADMAAKMKVDFGSNVYRTKIELAMQKDMRSGIALYEATRGKLNGADARAMGTMALDRGKQVEAETAVSTGMPVMGQYGNVTHWGGHIETAAATSGLPAPLIAAVASQESGGNANAVSPAGASGPMQFVPLTARQMGLKPGEEKLPEMAIPKGAEYLKQQVDKFGKVEGLMAYNWGPGNVQQWIDGGRKGAVPAETRNYVAHVLAKEAQFGGQAAGGDQLAQWKVAGYRYLDAIDRSDLDPEMKARMRAVAERRLNIGNAMVLEQRRSAADAGETAGIALFTGQYRAGTFQQISDQFRATGDSSNAEMYQVLANRESQAIELGKNAPAQMPIVGTLLPGAAGRIAHQQVAEARAEVTEARALAVQNRSENRRLSAEQEKIFDDGLAADVDPRVLKQNLQDAFRYAVAAGDMAKAKSLQDKFDGALQGSRMAALPPAERERARLELQQIVDSKAKDGLGLTVGEANALKFVERSAGKRAELWAADPLVAASHVRRADDSPVIQLQSFDISMDGVNLQMWATRRLSDTTIATRLQNPNATNIETPFFTQAEMSSISQKLDHMRPQEAQLFLAKLAVAVPREAIALIGQQMSKKDAVSDSYAAALGLYALGDLDVANRVIRGMNLWQKGGEDGKTRVDVKDDLFVAIDGVLGKARAGMNPDSVRQQNNAIIANYIGLTANAPDRKEIKTWELKQSILEIVGRATDHKGADTIIPREIESWQFRNGVAAITAADVADLRPVGRGQPVTAEVVRQNGQFVPVDVGKYQVRIPDPLRSGRTVELIDNNTGRPWVVDIKPLIARGVTGALRDLPTGQRDPLGMNRGTVELPGSVVTAPPAAAPAPTGAELIRQNQRRGLPGGAP